MMSVTLRQDKMNEELEFKKCLEEVMAILEKYKPKLYENHFGFKLLYNQIYYSLRSMISNE